VVLERIAEVLVYAFALGYDGGAAGVNAGPHIVGNVPLATAEAVAKQVI
jgi:hypothetical protein